MGYEKEICDTRFIAIILLGQSYNGYKFVLSVNNYEMCQYIYMYTNKKLLRQKSSTLKDDGKQSYL